MKRYVVKQNSSYSCATACVLSLIRYYGGNISYEELNVILNASRYGTNAFDILNGVKNIGFDGRGIKLSFEDLINYELTNPLIAHVISNNLYHFLVIYKIDKKRKILIVMDPSVGIKRIRFNEFQKIYLSTVLEIMPVGDIPKIKADTIILLKIFKLLSKYKILLSKIIVLSLFVIFFTLLTNILLKFLLELNNLKFLSMIFTIIILFKNLFNYLLEKHIISIQNTIGVILLKDIVYYIFKVPIMYFKNKNTGDILDRIRDLENIKDKLVDISLNIFVNILLLICIILLLAFINTMLFFITILFIFIYFIFSFIYYKYFKRKIFEVKNTYSLYESFANESISNYVSIKNLQVEDIFIGKLLSKYYAYLFKVKNTLNNLNNFEFVKNNLSDFFLILIVILAIILVNKNILKLSDLFFAYSLALSIIDPIKVIFGKFSLIEEVKVSVKRVNELFKIREEEQNPDKINGSICFRNVKLNLINKSYKINFSIPVGSLFLICGESGSGKSSILKIIAGQYTNYSGNIFVNDINIKDLENNVLMNSISIVSQEEKLFNETLENNIKLYRKVNREDYENILKITLVDKIRNSRKFRDDFVIYEDGINLSGGERQKIILARALLKNFNYLIIDEGLSEVNSEDEINIIKNIKNYFSDKTIIYVSHKKEIISLFKYRYFMKGGDEIV